ncbi:MAG TPA: long-chain fatty acid--CoA ligase [Streptosporangiaceae bacterium]|nr:long-chain fatty acid--CoA ligase [Streptosporangiaceae bacterium]
MANLAQILTDQAAKQPDHPALLAGGQVISYAEFDDASARVASFLARRGFQPGDRAGLMLPNVPEFCLVCYGVLRAGGTVVPMNPLLRSREVEYYLSDSGAGLLFADPDSPGEPAAGAAAAGADFVPVGPAGLGALVQAQPAAPGVADRADGDTALILYTSGTTGRPKGAELSHANLRTNAELTEATLLGLGPSDVVMGCLPLFHCFGLTCGLNAALTSGATLALLARFDAGQALELIQHAQVTVFEGVPTMYAALLHHPDRDRYDTSSVRACISGGAALPVELLRAFEAAFGTMILEGYGLSETSPVASFNHPDRARKPGSIGTPVRGVQMRLVAPDGTEVPAGEVGEIAVRGPNVMTGYWRRPDATREAIPDGWLRTGDLARQDEDGYFFIVDRKKDLVIRGGFNVYPREIEEVLYEHPAVAEAAVIGIPHPSLGEEIGAAAALKPGASATPEELRAFVKGRVAAYKYPRHIWLVESLPKGPTGKILRREVTAPDGLVP